MLFAKLSMVQCAARVAVLAQPVPESEVVFARVIVFYFGFNGEVYVLL